MGENVEREREGKSLEGDIVMDTPERGRITVSLSKFEDSPVFTYINNLSPLETVRPVRISQTFNSYSLSSVPSIFTSPHVSSLKETKLLKRSDPSNATCSSEYENKIRGSEGFVDTARKSEEQKKPFDRGNCIDKTLHEGNVDNEVLQNQRIGCYVTNNSVVTCHDREQNREEGSYDWSLSDAADFLIFESPDNPNSFVGSFLKPLDSESRQPVSKKTQDADFVGNEINVTENTLIKTGEGLSNAVEVDGGVLALTHMNNQATEVSNEAIVNESASNLSRGIRRRCLVYDMGGARRKFLEGGSTSSSFTLPKCHVTSTENTNSSRCILPGIGLHLNALARTSKDYNANNQEILPIPKQLANNSSSNSGPDIYVNTQETVNQSLALNAMDRDLVPVDDDDLNQSSAKKKKRKEENGGEGESCKRCNCKKSKCLKLYCECFAAGVYCVEPCSCKECFNKPIHEDIVLATRKQIESRNPLAFAPKVIRTADIVPEIADDSSNTPASARHKRGCNCKKSGCLKKYCECYQGGVGCSINCRCEGCKNAFGKKDGSHIILAEVEAEETENHEKSVANNNLSKHIISNNPEPNPDSALPETPTHSNRAPLYHPYSSKNKPPRVFLSTGSSSSTLYGGQKFGIPAFLKPHTNIEKQVTTNLGNEIPEILLSPASGTKSCSPNSKRISPPHDKFEHSLSPALRSSRKLILQSIPSFPSLKD